MIIKFILLCYILVWSRKYARKALYRLAIHERRRVGAVGVGCSELARSRTICKSGGRHPCPAYQHLGMGGACEEQKRSSQRS